MNTQKYYDTKILRRFLSYTELADIQLKYNHTRASNGSKPMKNINKFFRGEILTKALGKSTMETLHDRYQVEKKRANTIAYGVDTNSPYAEYIPIRNLDFGREAQIENFLWKITAIIGWIVALAVLL